MSGSFLISSSACLAAFTMVVLRIIFRLAMAAYRKLSGLRCPSNYSVMFLFVMGFDCAHTSSMPLNCGE